MGFFVFVTEENRTSEKFMSILEKQVILFSLVFGGEWVNEWMNEWMNERTNQPTNQPTIEQMN